MPDLAEGAVFAGHRIEGIAGRGGMGTVYRATHLALDHLVALKVISGDLADDESFRLRFKSESRIAVSLRHPNVVPIHHAGEEEGLLFVTMDLIDGPDLRKLLASRGVLSPPDAIAILEQIAAALDVAHSRGLVHRDIKPGNILIEQRAGSTGGEHAYLTDFGLTKRIEGASEATALTSTGAFVGTLDYVAPEQIQGERLDARTDVYALGCVLFEMLAGRAPFDDREEKVAKMYAHLQAEPPWLPGDRPAAEALDGVIARAMAKDPEQRYPSAGDLARAAAAAVGGESVREGERSVARGPAAPTETVATPVPATTQPGVPDFQSTAEAAPPLRAPAAPAHTTRTSVPPPAPGRARSRPIRPLSLLAALAVVGLLAFVAISALGGEEDGGDDAVSEQGGGGTGAAASPPQVGEPVPVAGQPVGVAAEDAGVFAVSRTSAEMTPIDPDAEQADPAVQLGGGGEDVAVASGSVWVTEPLTGDGAVAVAPVGGGEATSIPLAGEPRGILAADGFVYVASLLAGTVSRLDPELGPEAVPELVADGLSEPHGLAFADGMLWISERDADRVTRLELGSGERDVFEVGNNPKGVAVADGTVWVANTDDGTVSRLDADTGEPLGDAPIEVGGQPRAVEIGLGGVWVSNGGEPVEPPAEPDGYVSLLDASSGEPLEPRIDVEGSPEGLAVGDGRVWVTTGTADSIVPIDP